MKILIIEDKALHILSAQKFAQECGHDVTIATSYDEAEKALCGETNDDRFARNTYTKKYDVVMTDLLMPTSPNGLSREGAKHLNQEMAYGLIFMLLAMRTEVKALGLMTDASHHDHPMTWALDPLGGYSGQAYKIGEMTLLFGAHELKYTSSLWNDEKKEDKPNYVPKGDPLEGAKDWMEFFLKLMAAVGPLGSL